MMDITLLQKEFLKVFGHDCEHVYFAPGRINLIGEHTDYNGGYVFPCAIDFGTYVLISPNKSENLQFRSFNFPQAYSVSINKSFAPLPDKAWANYSLGCVAQFVKKGVKLPCGFDILVGGNVPPGAGLSSSASLEIATAFAFNDILSAGLSLTDLALIGQKAEHEYANVNCGIMDQFVSAHGKKDYAVFLNCSTLEFQLIPIRLDGVKLVITNTHSPHKLDAGSYNERVSQCQQALSFIQKEMPGVSCLADITVNEWNEIENIIPDVTCRRRAKHVIYETDRTKRAVKALQEGNIVLFGKLMNESHLSLEKDYEVTGIELDTLAHTAWDLTGVIGSRMTGGGFGGCTVSLVEESFIPSFKKKLGSSYKERTGLDAEFYVSDISDGAKKIF